MGRALSEAFPTARRTFEEANDVLGYDLARLCFEGPAEDLTLTHICQPAILTTSVAAWRVAKESGVTGDLAMGHSLGEYSALVACGSLGFEEALRLVQARGDATTDVSAAHPGQMVALLGASDEDVEALCAEAGEVWPANYNSPGQVVASGLHRGVRPAAGPRPRPRHQGPPARRGRRVPLVGHGAGDREAARGALEREDLGAVAALPLGRRRRASSAASACARCWPSSSRRPVRFTQTVRMALDHGVDGFVEFGHRRVLVGLVRRIRPERQRGQPRRPGGPARPPGDGGARGVGRCCRCRSR